MAAVEFIGVDEADEDWMREAACKGLTYLFFPSSAERPQARERREATARHVCGTCPVRERCRQFARAATTSTGSGAARARTSATPPATD